MNQIQLHMLDISHSSPMDRSRLIATLEITDGQYRWASSGLLKESLISKRLLSKKVLLSITDQGRAELARRKQLAPKTVPTMASGHFINKMKLPIYKPAEELKFYRNDGNKHIKSRGY